MITQKRLNEVKHLFRHGCGFQDAWDAVDDLQIDCPGGWRAGLGHWWGHGIPANAVIVGSVRVRTSDPAFPLYVMPEVSNPGTEIRPWGRTGPIGNDYMTCNEVRP